MNDVAGLIVRHGVVVACNTTDADELCRIEGADGRVVMVPWWLFIRWATRRAGRERPPETCERVAVAAYAHPRLMKITETPAWASSENDNG